MSHGEARAGALAFDPEVVILGGGILRSADAIVPHVQAYVDRHAWTPWGRVEVRRADQLANAALLGVASLVYEGVETLYIHKLLARLFIRRVFSATCTQLACTTDLSRRTLRAMLSPGTYCVTCGARAPREEDRDGVRWYHCGSCGVEQPRALIVDPRVRMEETPRGIKHWTVGALIEKDHHFLLIHKQQWPFLWDVLAGHLEVGEDPAAAVRREVQEESGLELLDPKRVFHGEIFPDPCRKGALVHEWYLYRGRVVGSLRPAMREVRELRWVTREEMLTLPFVRPAYVLFDAIGLWGAMGFQNKKNADSP